MGPNLFVNYYEAASMILFGIGFTTMLLHPNLIKKIIGLNIMDTAIYLFLGKRVYSRQTCTDYCKRRSGNGNIYKPYSKQPCSHRYRCFSKCNSYLSVSCTETLQKISYSGHR